MRNKEYNQFFRELARTHVGIQHTDQECRFVRFTLSADPIAKVLDLREFYDSLKFKLKLKEKYAMLLQAYEKEFSDNVSDNKRAGIYGAFVIIGKVKEGDFDQLEEVQDGTEEVATEIVGSMLHHFENNFSPFRRMTANEITLVKIGPVGDSFYGTRCDFSFSEPANAALKYKPEKFIK